MADKKIPLLTEVYQPKAGAEPARQNDPTLGITPELISRLAAHIKPRLEADIAKSVEENVRAALKQELLKELENDVISTQAAIESRTVDFVDKTKADLKTELPRMYQASADRVYGDLSAKISGLQNTEISKFNQTVTTLTEESIQSATKHMQAHAEQMQTNTMALLEGDLKQKLEAYQKQVFEEQKVGLNQEIANLFESLDQAVNQQAQVIDRQKSHFSDQAAQLSEALNNQVSEQTQAFEARKAQLDTDIAHTFETLGAQSKRAAETQLEDMQAEALSKLQTRFVEAMPAIYQETIEQQQQALSQKILEELNLHLQTTQTSLVEAHQARLKQALLQGHESALLESKEMLQQQMRTILEAASAQLRTNLIEATPEIYSAAADTYKAKFAEEMTAQSMEVRENFLATVNADLPAVQEVLRDNIEQILAPEMTRLESDLRLQLTTELRELLQTVKFVLPKQG